MYNNFKFKTRHVSIVQRSPSVVNSFVSSVKLTQAMTYKLKRDTNQNFGKLTYNFKMRVFLVLLEHWWTGFTKSTILG